MSVRVVAMEPQDWETANAGFLADVFASITRRLEEMAAAQGAGGKVAIPHHWLDAPADTAPALMMLRDAFFLTPFETAIVALCAAFELDSEIGALCARALGDASCPWPTFALALNAFEMGSWDAVAASGPLRHWRLIEVDRAPGQPLVRSLLRCDERILDFIKGLNRLDEVVGAWLTPIEMMSGDGDPAAVPTLSHAWGSPHGPPPVVLFGAEASTRAATAAAAARECGRKLFRIEGRALPAAPVDLDQLTRLWRREAALLPLALLVDITAEDAAADGLLRRFVAKLDVPVAISVDRGDPKLVEDFLGIAVEPPGTCAQEAAWREALGDRREAIAGKLAGTFDFSLETIHRIATTTSGDGADDAVWQECAAIVRPKLDSLAQRIEPRAGWDDLVVPEAQRATLREIVDQVRLRRQVYDDWGYRAKLSRGLGITAAFAGESGTGKTMAAEVLARELGVNLYRIDLSAIVSKYIGETEKNLRQLFDAAERGGAMLMFDEADALFGKRSEVKDSHDRYANIEVNYLLQRLEAFSGLAILATNMKAALDTAFLRRLRFVVQFPYPGPTERRALWRGAFPNAVPLGKLDYDQLARINLTGGNISAAAINAAFLAASEGANVSMDHVLRSARSEMTKLNRPINEADFVAPTAARATAR
jgi:AAA+ superfamily predicted ATPase